MGEKMRFDFALVSYAVLLQVFQQAWVCEGNDRELALNFLAMGLFRLRQIFFKIDIPGGLFLLRRARRPALRKWSE